MSQETPSTNKLSLPEFFQIQLSVDGCQEMKM